MIKFVAAAVVVVTVGSCAFRRGGERSNAERLGISLADAEQLEEDEQVTDADLGRIPHAALVQMIERMHAPRDDHPLEALQWRAMTMKDAAGQVPQGALMAAKQQVQGMGGLVGGAVGGLDAGSWQALGPDNIGGRTRGLAIHPTMPSMIFAGSVGGGIWRSTDSGASWQRLGDSMSNLAITCILFTPGNAQVMYAATGEGFGNIDGVRGAGIWKSTDTGDSWAQLAATDNANFNYVNSIAMSPNGTTLLAATGSGMWRSLDGGVSFAKVAGSGNARCLDVDFHPTDDSRAVAQLIDYDAGINSYYNTVMYSTDGGASWTELTGAPRTNAYYDRTELAFHRGYSGGGGGCVYAQKYIGSSGSTELYRSLDGGASYTLVSTTTITGGQGWYDNAIWVDPSDTNSNPADDVIVVGGTDIYRSTDGGASFTRVSQWSAWPQSAHADQHRIVEDPGFNGTTDRKVYVVNDGGIWSASDIYSVSSSGWNNLNHGYAVTQFYGGSRNDSSGILIGGTQDNGTLRTTTSTSWTTMYGGDGGFCASDPTDGNYHYGEYVYLQMHRSNNGGLTASSIYGPIAGGNFIAPFVLDPNDHNVMLAGGNSLWRSTDVRSASPSWTATKANSGSPISAIAVVPGNGDVQYVGHDNGDVYLTTDGRAAVPNWTRLDNNPPSLPNRYVTRIVVDPANSNRVFVTFGGFASDNVWVTTNSGASWAALTGLPSAPVRDLEINPAHPDWLYAATEVGLLISEDDGASWSSAATPATVSIDEMFWSGNSLYLVTHGLGMFRQSPFASATVSDVGTACTIGGPLSGPVLGSNLPIVGGNWFWYVIGAPANSVAVLWWSNVPAAPVQLSPGCFAQLDLPGFSDLGVRLVPASGFVSWTTPVANNLSFCGIQLMSQAALLTTTDIQVSNGRLLTVGL